MSKFAISHGQTTVPMNLFATWEVDRSSPQCIPRVCSLALGKLTILKELDRDVQSVFIAVKMQGSKRVLRSNEIALPPNGMLDIQLELTFSLQYPHFVKRDGNVIQIMLQRKKRYKNRAILGYKTLAVGTIDMAQIIQSPIIEESFLDLISPSKDRGIGTVLVAQVGMSSVYSTPTDEGEVAAFGRTGKPHETDRSPDADNYTDDEEMSSSDPEMGSDVNPQELSLDEDTVPKHKHRRKIRMSSSSRQQNFIKAKLVALLRRFKQVADEQGLEPDLVQGPNNDVAGEVDLDFLYDEIEDLNLSDSCPEVEDNISIVSTPKPKLKPFFDRTSHSSSQTEVCSLRDQQSAENYQGHGPYDSKDNSWDRHHGMEATFHSLQASEHTPAIDRTDSSEGEEDDDSISYRTSGFSKLPVPLEGDSGSEPSSPVQKHVPVSSPKRRKRSWPRSRSPSFSHEKLGGKMLEIESSTEDLDTVNTKSLSVIHGSFAVEESEAEDTDASAALPSIVLLIDSSERNGRALADAFQNCGSSCNLDDLVILGTNTVGQLHTVFNALITKLQKFVNTNSNQPMRLKFGVAGTEPYMSHVLREFVDLLSSRPPDWISYFLFLPILSDKQRLGCYLSSLDTRYAKLFNDHIWREFFDKAGAQVTKMVSPASSYPSAESGSIASAFEKQQAIEKTVTRRILEYLEEASAAYPLSIAEAMLTFGEKSENEDCPQRFIPFISEAKVGDNEPIYHQDSDKEDTFSFGQSGPPNAVSATSAPVHAGGSLNVVPSSPTVLGASNLAHPSISAAADLKIGLQVDYWKDRDSTKYTLKSTFRSFNVSSLPELGEQASPCGLCVDFVTVGKKNLMRLPGKKGKEKESDSKSQVISSINRLICASKHQHYLLKVRIDGIEWKEVKFFQLSSHWSSHVKVFPVGLFSAH